MKCRSCRDQGVVFVASLDEPEAIRCVCPYCRINYLIEDLEALEATYKKLEAWASMRDAGHDDLRKKLNAANAHIRELQRDIRCEDELEQRETDSLRTEIAQLTSLLSALGVEVIQHR